jgi:hypothetical protein
MKGSFFCGLGPCRRGGFNFEPGLTAGMQGPKATLQSIAGGRP